MIYIDESGIDRFLQRDYARSPRGMQVISNAKGKKFQRVSMISGKCGKNIIAPMIYRGTADTKLFEGWVEHCLLPELTAGKVIVMDNYSIHKSNKTKGIIENAGCKIVFLPPYSPDLNPIEKFWAWIKNKVRNLLPNSSSLEDAICEAFKEVK